MVLKYLFLAVGTSFLLILLSPSNSSATSSNTGETNSKYYLELARVHQKYGFSDKAIEMCQKAIDVETNDEEKQKLRVSLSQIYLLAGNTAKAESIAQETINSEKDKQKKAEYCLVLGEIAEKLGKRNQAIEAYEFVVSNSKENLYVHTARQKMMNLLKENGKFADYISQLEKRVKDNPDDTEALECLAYAYLADETLTEKANAILLRLFDLKPDDSAIANRLVQIYRRSGEYEKAIAVYLKLMESSPQIMNKLYYERISDLYTDAHKEEDALKWDIKVMEEDPDNPYSCLKVAERCSSLGKSDDAEEMYLSAIGKLGREDEKEAASIKLIDLYIADNKFESARKLSSEVLSSAKDEKTRKELEPRIAHISEHLQQDGN